MAGRNCFGVSEVYTWLSSISHGLNLERLAPEFERRGFQSMHSLKYIGQNDQEVIINSPDKLLLAERRILEKELEEIKKPSLQPKELFPSPYSGSLQVVSPINSPVLVSTTRSGPASSSSNVPVSRTMDQQSAVNESNEQSTTYLEKKSGELTENLSIIQTQIKSATDQLEIVRNQYEQASSKANGRRRKLCTRSSAGSIQSSLFKPDLYGHEQLWRKRETSRKQKRDYGTTKAYQGFAEERS